jgi:hypothetical protein
MIVVKCGLFVNKKIENFKYLLSTVGINILTNAKKVTVSAFCCQNINFKTNLKMPSKTKRQQSPSRTYTRQESAEEIATRWVTQLRGSEFANEQGLTPGGNLAWLEHISTIAPSWVELALEEICLHAHPPLNTVSEFEIIENRIPKE